MRWKDVNYLCHGYWCTVVFDTHDAPEHLNRFDGKICCAVPLALPYLENLSGTKPMHIPEHALVVLGPAPKPSEIW